MRNFSARETEWLLELDGIELAPFWRRAFAYAIDWTLVGLLMSILFGGAALLYFTLSGQHLGKDGNYNFSIAPGHTKINIESDSAIEKLFDNEPVHLLTDIAIPVLYFGLLTWRGHGRSPGKRLLKIRVVSLVHRHLNLWHSIERALGYGAAALEGGFGFFQFFIHPYRRCVQDRIAETIVVTEAGYRAMQHKLAHPLLPDDGHIPPERIVDEILSPDALPGDPAV